MCLWHELLVLYAAPVAGSGVIQDPTEFDCAASYVCNM